MTTTPSSANLSSCLGCTSYADARSRKTSSTSSPNMTTKQCEYCQSQFKVKANSPGVVKRFCSAKCSSRKRNNIPKKCINCGKDFPGRHSKYCSRRCLQQFNKAKMQEDNFAYKLRITYRMTVEEYEALLLQQDGRCAICRKLETSKFKNTIKRLSVDHCHETGQVRGLLCQRCNFAIGQFEDDWLLLDNAIEYLGHWHNKHGSSKVTARQESPSLN